MDEVEDCSVYSGFPSSKQNIDLFLIYKAKHNPYTTELNIFEVNKTTKMNKIQKLYCSHKQRFCDRVEKCHPKKALKLLLDQII